MPSRHERTVGEDLSGTETELLTLLCSGDDAESAKARDQLRAASWGGYPHDDCECILVTVAAQDDAPRIDHDGGPFSMLEVARDGETLGFVELWVVDGHLHSLDYMPLEGAHVHLPSREFTIEPIARD